MTARTPIRAALVDLDGTLLDTAPDLAQATNAMLVGLGYAPLEAATVRDFVGKGVDHLVQRALECATGGPPAAGRFAAAREAFGRHYATLNGSASRVYPGVREGLAAMRAAGLSLACVTNKLSAYTLPLLTVTGLAPCFEAVVTSDTAGARKPDPAIFLDACRRVGVPPAQACVIGDSDNDGQGARAAGCMFLLVPYGYREGRAVQDIEADGIVESLLHAATVLRNTA